MWVVWRLHENAAPFTVSVTVRYPPLADRRPFIVLSRRITCGLIDRCVTLMCPKDTGCMQPVSSHSRWILMALKNSEREGLTPRFLALHERKVWTSSRYGYSQFQKQIREIEVHMVIFMSDSSWGYSKFDSSKPRCTIIMFRSYMSASKRYRKAYHCQFKYISHQSTARRARDYHETAFISALPVRLMTPKNTALPFSPSWISCSSMHLSQAHLDIARIAPLTTSRISPLIAPTASAGG